MKKDWTPHVERVKNRLFVYVTSGVLAQNTPAIVEGDDFAMALDVTAHTRSTAEFAMCVRSVIGKKPIHLLTEDERKRVPKMQDLWIDIGVSSKEEAENDIFSDTVSTENALTERHEEYDDLLSAFAGEGELRFVKQKIIRSVDESWVKAVEDCLPALDEVTRNPSHFIEETEELLPIERTKKVTTRSIRHLSQHTGLISRIEGDVVIPSKLLNVFRDESVMTYENKFINTLLIRLYDFVVTRYEEAEEFGASRRLHRRHPPRGGEGKGFPFA